MKPWLLVLLIILSPWVNAAEEWVRLEACGRQAPSMDQHEFVVPYEPAKNLKEFLVRREAISALIAPRYIGTPTDLKCTYVILTSGEQLLVIGSPEEVRRKITGEAK